MNLNTINTFINNEKSKELHIEIIAGGKTYLINSIYSDFDNETLEIHALEKPEE